MGLGKALKKIGKSLGKVVKVAAPIAIGGVVGKALGGTIGKAASGLFGRKLGGTIGKAVTSALPALISGGKTGSNPVSILLGGVSDAVSGGSGGAGGRLDPVQILALVEAFSKKGIFGQKPSLDNIDADWVLRNAARFDTSQPLTETQALLKRLLEQPSETKNVLEQAKQEYGNLKDLLSGKLADLSGIYAAEKDRLTSDSLARQEDYERQLEANKNLLLNLFNNLATTQEREAKDIYGQNVDLLKQQLASVYGDYDRLSNVLEAEKQRLLSQPTGYGEEWKRMAIEELQNKLDEAKSEEERRLLSSMAARGLKGGVVNNALLRLSYDTQKAREQGLRNILMEYAEADWRGRQAQNEAINRLLGLEAGSLSDKQRIASALGSNIAGLGENLSNLLLNTRLGFSKETSDALSDYLQKLGVSRSALADRLAEISRTYQANLTGATTNILDKMADLYKTYGGIAGSLAGAEDERQANLARLLQNNALAISSALSDAQQRAMNLWNQHLAKYNVDAAQYSNAMQGLFNLLGGYNRQRAAQPIQPQQITVNYPNNDRVRDLLFTGLINQPDYQSNLRRAKDALATATGLAGAGIFTPFIRGVL